VEASFIDGNGGFTDIGEECDIRKRGDTRQIRRAIVMRMVSLYREWFNELRLAEFFPE
jgi:hypothetical protein